MIRRREPIKRGAAPKRGKRPKARSTKRDEAVPERRAVVAFVHERDGETCQARKAGVGGGCLDPLDVHEILPRGRGGDWLDPENCLLVCRGHHDWIHAHPIRAKALGLLR